jgi:hypothetical protein
MGEREQNYNQRLSKIQRVLEKQPALREIEFDLIKLKQIDLEPFVIKLLVGASDRDYFLSHKEVKSILYAYNQIPKSKFKPKTIFTCLASHLTNIPKNTLARMLQTTRNTSINKKVSDFVLNNLYKTSAFSSKNRIENLFVE